MPHAIESMHALIILCPLQPVNKPLKPCMLFSMHMHKHKAKASSIRPTNLGHFDGERLIRVREFDMEGQARAGRQRFLTHYMAPLLGETRDQSASGNITAGKRKWHLNFVTGAVATLHECLLLSNPQDSAQDGWKMDTLFSRRNQPPSPSVTRQASRVRRSLSVQAAARGVSVWIRTRICFSISLASILNSPVFKSTRDQPAT